MVSRSLVLFAVLALSACALDPQGGYRPINQQSASGRSGTSPEVKSFDQANAECWTVSMNIAGYGATIAQLEAYKGCMARAGWADQRSLF